MDRSWPIDGSLLTPVCFRRRWVLLRDVRARMLAHRSQVVARVLSGGNLSRYRAVLAQLQENEATVAAAYREQVMAALRAGMTLAERAAEISLQPAAFDPDEEDGVDHLFKGRDVAPRPMTVRVIAPETPIPSSVEKRGAERAAMLRRLITPKAVTVLPSRHAADEIAADLMAYAPWLRPAIELIWRDMLASVGGPLVLRPLLLVGPPGCGKTALTMRLAGLLRMPMSRLEMSGTTAVFDITGLEFNWSESRPGEPISLIDTSGQATVLMVLDEVEKAGRSGNGGDPLSALLPLLNRDTARTFRSPWLATQVDLSHVSWVLTANELSLVPRPLLDRLRVVEVGMPTGPALRDLIGRVLGGVDLHPEAAARIEAQITAGRLSLRGLERIAQSLHEVEGRGYLN